MAWFFLLLLVTAPGICAEGNEDSRSTWVDDLPAPPTSNTSQAEEELKKADPRRDHLATLDGELDKKPAGKSSDEKPAADIPEKPQVWPPQLSEAIQKKLDFSSQGENQAELKSKGIDPKTMGHRAAIAQMVEDQNPAGLKLMVDAAMRRFPDDPVFQDLHKLIEPHFAAGHFDHIAKRTLEESRKLFGVQLIPSDTMEGDAGEVPIRTGKKQAARATTATSAQDVVDRSFDLIDKNNPALADKLLTREILRNRSDPNLYDARALARYYDGDLKGSDEDSLSAIKLCPGNSQVYANRAWLMREMGRWSESQAWAERALQEDPTNAWARSLRAKCLWREGKGNLARKEFELLAKSDPGFLPLYEQSMTESPAILSERRRKVMKLIQSGNYAAAMRETDQLLDLDSRDTVSHGLRASMFLRQGNLDAAIQEANISLKIYPDNASALWNRALAYHTQGNRKAAAMDFDRAGKLEPTYQKLYKELMARQPPSWRDKAADALSALASALR
ncbi:MAG: tetratricopeptide repeat protein [Elusimicrobiota bacterium]